MRALYDLWYRFGTPPWVTGPREELVSLVESGRLAPCRAIDLGCGSGDNAIFLAQHGFDVTGIDFAPSAIAQARQKAEAADVVVRFEVDDLTELRHEYGAFDLLVDYGTLDDMGPARRARYLREVVPLARPGAHFLLWCFEWELSRAERALRALLPAGEVAFQPGEVDAAFAAAFDVERIAGETRARGWPRGYATYLMTRVEREGGWPA